MKSKDKPKPPKSSNAIKITNESNQGNNVSASIKADFNKIKEQILSDVREELFSQPTESIGADYKTIVNMIEVDILSKVNKAKGAKMPQEFIKKKLEVLIAYACERERENEEAKVKAMDSLSHYLTQLSNIIFNYLQLNREGEEMEGRVDQGLHQGGCLDEKFVVLINKLSKIIKAYTSKAQLLAKASNDLMKSINDKLLLCRSIASDISLQATLISKESIKAIQSKGRDLNEMLEGAIAFNSRLSSKGSSIESNQSAFYSEAKDVFRKLKTLQSEFKSKAAQQEVNRGEAQPKQFLLNESPKPTRQVPLLLSKQKRLMSHSSNHFSNTQKIYLNHINNSFNEACMLTTSPINTEPQDVVINLNNTDDPQGRGGHWTDLLVSNKCLQTKVDNLNSTMTKTNFERKRIKKELDEIKRSFNKRKHHLSTSVDTVTRQNESSTNTCTKALSSKNDYLAKQIVEFMQNMKDLQEAIVNKHKDVALKKKAFEKKKKELLYLATDYKDKASVSSIEREVLIDDKEEELNRSKKMKELKEQNNRLMVEIEMKKAEVGKIQEAYAKKQSIPMAKMKEFENIIKVLKGQIDPLKEDKRQLESSNSELKKEIETLKKTDNKASKCNESALNELNHYIDRCSFLTAFSLSLMAKVNNIHCILTQDKQPIEYLIISKELDKEDISKADQTYAEIVKCLSSQPLTKQQQASTASTVNPIKTPQPSPSQFLQDENAKLKALFEECMSTIYASIKDKAPEIFEDDDDLSFNYGSGLNTPVNLLDSNNSNQNQSATATIDKDNVQAAVEMFKKYNVLIHSELAKAKEEKLKVDKENELLLLRSETYKTALEEAMRANPSQNEKEFIINFNKSTQSFSLQDIAETPNEVNPIEAIANQRNKGLMMENERLKAKLKVLSEELKDKTETELKENTKEFKARTKNCSFPCTCASNYDSKDNDFKELYFKSEKRVKELEEQYETLVKEVINSEVEAEEGKEKPNTFMQMINSNHFANDNLCLNKNFDAKMLDLDDQHLDEHENLLLTQLNAIKSELKEQREANRELKEENDCLKKKTNELSTLKGSERNDFAGPIKAALERLMLEITVTVKVKELLCVIFKFIGCSEEEISKVFAEKEKRKSHKKLFS